MILLGRPSGPAHSGGSWRFAPPVAARLVLAPKVIGMWRLMLDLHRLNKLLELDRGNIGGLLRSWLKPVSRA